MRQSPLEGPLADLILQDFPEARNVNQYESHRVRIFFFRLSFWGSQRVCLVQCSEKSMRLARGPQAKGFFKKLITQALGYLGHIGIGHPHILTPLLIVFLPESDRVIFTSKCLVRFQKHFSTFATSYQNVIFSKALFYLTKGSSGFSWALWGFSGLSLS